MSLHLPLFKSAIAGGIALAAIATSAFAADPTRVALVPGGPHPYFAAWEQAGKDAVKDFKLGAADYRVPQKWELSQQNELLESLLSQKYNAFLIFPGDPVGSNSTAAELADAGAPVIALAGCLKEPTKALFCFGTDTGNSAYLGTKELIKAMGGKGRIAHFTGFLVDPNTQLRIDAVNKAAEARNEGSVTRIHATELEQTKARQEAVKEVMKSKDMGLNAAEHYVATLNTNAVAKYGHDVSRMNAAERTASQLEIANLKRQSLLDNFERNYGAALNKTEYGSLSKERAKLQSDLAPLAGADQNLAFIKGKKDRLQQIETRMEQIQNAFLGGIANNAAGSTSAPTAKKATYRMENGQIVPNK